MFGLLFKSYLSICCPRQEGVVENILFWYMLLKFISSQCARGKSFIAQNPEDNPQKINGKKTFQTCYPLEFKFYLGNLNNKIFPIWSYLNFVSLFTALNITKSKDNLTLHDIGKTFIS